MPRFLLLLCLFPAGCIDPLPVGSLQGEPVLVVDGLITDQPGPYTVRLSWSSAVMAPRGEPEKVTGASVRIHDRSGLDVELRETSPGTYVTPADAIRGTVGNTYTLTIVTVDGHEYQSQEETMMPSGDIVSLSSAFEEGGITTANPSRPADAVRFFLDGKADPAYPAGLTRWRSRGVYVVETHPELRTKKINDRVIPDPLPCSGFINLEDSLVRVGPCVCCTCWVVEYNHEANVSLNQYLSNNEFSGVPVMKVPVDTYRFLIQYTLEVEQLSVSERVHEFWKRVSAQQKGTGSLFQPNAVKVVGNIRCATDPAREAFGIFSASAVVRKSISTNRYAFPVLTAGPPDIIKFDCRYAFENSYNEPPEFW